MAISTNSVIHYTEKLEHLEGIIKCQGFRLKYCTENLDIQLPDKLSFAVPMVSFCDIPLSEVKNHIDSYGSYGIGLTKNWAKESGLNPVLYLEQQSRIAANIGAQYSRILKIRHKSKTPDENLQNEFTTFVSYCKNYEGRLVRGKINSDKYRFYDEREWRFVATKKDIKENFEILNIIAYADDKDGYNDKISDCFLKFYHKDISYIIVDSENEIPGMLTLLNETYEDTCTTKELKILSTKILTKNQICNDF